MQTFLNVVALIFVVVMLFNIIIFVHELGHFLAGRWRGLKIDRFQIWFGKPIWKKEYKGVQYGLGWIPAGGFVSLPQMAPMESIEGGVKGKGEALPPITPMDKIIVAVAGPLFSLLLALVAGLAVWGVGKPKDFMPSTTIGYADESMPGYKAGLRVGDKILEVNGEKVEGFRGSLNAIVEKIILSSGDEIKFTVQREGKEEPLEISSKFEKAETKWWQRSGMREVGIEGAGKSIIDSVAKNSPAQKAGLAKGDEILSVNGEKLFSPLQLMSQMKKLGYTEVELQVKKANGEMVLMKIKPVKPIKPVDSDPKLGIGWNMDGEIEVNIVHPDPLTQVGDSVKMMWVTIMRLIDPQSSINPSHLSGPVGIGQVLYSLLQTENGWRRILAFLVLFNVNLAIFNMLPLPVLDGGHIMLALLEKIRGKAGELKILETIQTVCALALFALFLFVTSKDLADLVGGGGGGGPLEFAE